MAFYCVPILNDEYKVYIFIGTAKYGNKQISHYLKEKAKYIGDCNRGKCVYCEGFHPCIWVDGRLRGRQFYATLAHEAVHAVQYIMCYICMDARDVSGDEFLAHSVAAVIRAVKSRG